jgi:hypothetical protein
MISSILITFVAAVSTALAAPGYSEGDSWGNKAYTTCSTSLCTSSSVYTQPTTIYETNTVYVSYTSYSESYVYETKTLTSTETKTITTSTPSVITTWIPVTTESLCEVPYTSVCTEETKVPYTTSSASVSVCPITSGVAYTTAWVATETVCSTGWSQGGWGNSHSSKAGGW